MKWLNAFKEHPWNSALQLFLGGMLIYGIAVFAGPHYGCGAGNSNTPAGVFTCNYGTMSLLYKVMIVACIVAASLCWGRAMSLLDGRSVKDS